MDNNAGICQRPCRAPLVVPPLDLISEVLRTDVDGAGSLMGGLTIVPSVNAVLSLPSVTSPSSPAMFQAMEARRLPHGLVDRVVIYQCSRHSAHLPTCPVGQVVVLLV